MKRRLPLPALALATLLVAGCGQEQPGEVATEPGTSSSPSSSSSGASTLVAILTGTATGGTVSLEPTLLDSSAAVDAFVAQFDRPGLDQDIRAAVAGAAVPDGHVPVGVVIAIGCDIPPGVDVDTRAGVTITAQKGPKQMQECFAAMTSVAILTLDSSLL